MMKTRSIAQLIETLAIALFGVYLGVILVSDIALSFSWANGDDSSFLYYLSWLMNEWGYKPYLQVYDTSFPGTFLAYMAITQLFGYSSLSYHVADTAILASLLVITWYLLKPVHIRVAWVATLLFGIYYITSSYNMHMQRDYLAILPAALAFLVAQHTNTFSFARASFLIGFLFAMSASIKPHFAIGWPVIWFAALLICGPENTGSCVRTSAKGALFTLAGFLCWVLACVMWLVTSGSWNVFVDMATKYLPLYLDLNGGHQVTTSWRDNWYALFHQMINWPLPHWALYDIAAQKNWPLSVRDLVMGIKPDWALSAAAAIWALINLPVRRLQVVTILALLVMCFLYVFYVALGAKGWNYHWMPFWYFNILCVGLLLVPLRENFGVGIWKFFSWIPFFIMVTYVHFRLDLFVPPEKLTGNIQRIKNEYTLYPIKDPNTEDLVSFLKQHTDPGEKVELRVTGTSGPFFRALLEAELLPATRFQLQLMFYLYTENNHAVSLRQVLLSELATPPRFLLDDNQFSLLANPDGSSRFPEYEVFLEENYTKVYDNLDRIGFPHQFIVYKRKDE